MSIIRIAIDGPSGAGKSTLAQAAADALGCIYVDTGAIYRTIGLHVWKCGLDPANTEGIVRELPHLQIELHYDNGQQRMVLNGQDVTEEIRLPEVSQYTSSAAAIPAVRAYLLEMQRELAKTHSVVMDGRDIGTVVLPDAEVKIFLTASAQARAQRRMLELERRGTPQPYEKVLREIEERDWRDSHRSAAPLQQAADAVRLDTTALNFQESLDALLKIVQERGKAHEAI